MNGTDSNAENSIRCDTTSMVFEYSKSAPLVNVLLALLTVVILEYHNSSTQHLFWVAAVVAVTIARKIYIGMYERSPTDFKEIERLFKLYSGLVLLNAFLWGILPVVTQWSAENSQQAFVPIFLAALTAGGLTIFNPVLWLAQGYVVAICLPFGIYCLTGSTQSMLFGVSVVAYGAYMVTICRSMNAVTIKTLLLRMEKDILIKSLDNSKKEAEAASQSKSDFLARMSHEIRTPLNGIIGVASLVRDQITDRETVNNIDTIRRSGEVLLAIVNDILDVTKIEAGKINLHLSPFHLGDELKRIESLFAPIALSQGVLLRTEIDEKCQRAWIGDILRIGQVLTNLISNAVKFTTRGGEVILRAKRDTSGRIVFSVEDTGIGIPKKDLERIFNAFEQVDGSLTRKFGGSGLGLTICSFLVGKMGGELKVTSLENLGSTFSFSLALEPYEKAETVPAYDRGDKIFDPSISVLLAEDNLVNQIVARKMLEKSGCLVTTVENGQDVLRILDTHSFDVVLLDCQMPLLDGYETAKAIRKWGEIRKIRVPIVAVTAQALTGDMEKCTLSGMDGFVAKPFNYDVLVNEIKRVLSMSPRHLC